MISKNISNNVLPSYDEIENTPNYSSAPYDETAKNYKNFSKDIDLPDHEIMVIDPEYLTTRHTVFCIREGFSNYTGHTIVVFNNENKEIFNCKKKSNSMILYDSNNTPILNSMANYSLKNVRINLYDHLPTTVVKENISISSGKTTNSKYGKFYTEYHYNKKLDKIIYKVEFTNSITNNTEILEIRHSVKSKENFVYCNVGEENETAICKIKRNNAATRMEYIVEVAPRVDYMYMFALCIGIMKLNVIQLSYNG